MTPIPELKQIERKAYWSYHQDGLIDLCLGLIFLLFGIKAFTGNFLFAGLCWMPGLMIAPLKKMITAPRIGTVRFGRSRKILAVKIGALVLTAAVILFIVVATRLKSPGLDAWTRHYYAIAFGSALALFPLAGAIGFGVRRFYAYAVLLVAGFSFIQYRPHYLAAVFAAVGSVLIIAGGAVLIRFLRDNPLPGKEKSA
jgi:hypothetical protein